MTTICIHERDRFCKVELIWKTTKIWMQNHAGINYSHFEWIGPVIDMAFYKAIWPISPSHVPFLPNFPFMSIPKNPPKTSAAQLWTFTNIGNDFDLKCLSTSSKTLLPTSRLGCNSLFSDPLSSIFSPHGSSSDTLTTLTAPPMQNRSNG